MAGMVVAGGMMAAMTAREGLKGSESALEGAAGFLNAFCGGDARQEIEKAWADSLPTLGQEFEINRAVYDWVVDNAPLETRPRQYEFARLNLTYTVMSKRKLLELVTQKYVSGWDDPRMPTISGLRRRGYTPKSIRDFSEAAGIAKRDNVTDLALLEFHIRNELNKTAPRVMAVLDPVKLVITNYPEGQDEILTAENNPEDEEAGSRSVPFSREIYIERDDFREDAPRKWFRLAPGRVATGRAGGACW